MHEIQTWNLSGDGQSPMNIFVTFKNHIMHKINFTCSKIKRVLALSPVRSKNAQIYKLLLNTYSFETK